MIIEGEYPINLAIRNCANGETMECFLMIGDPRFASRDESIYVNRYEESSLHEIFYRLLWNSMSTKTRALIQQEVN